MVKYTAKIGAVLLILMGVMTLTGMMNGFTSYLSQFGGGQESASSAVSAAPDTSEESSSASQEPAFPAPDFTLTDQYGKQHKLSDFKGKTVFLNFWATWCGPCRSEMPEIQALYEKYGKNEKDLIVLGVAGPNQGNEGSTASIKKFLKDNRYTFPVVMDESGDVFAEYGIRAFPTTFMIDKEGNIFGYVESALTGDVMESIVQQTMSGKRTS